jgi:hypothetical protein
MANSELLSIAISDRKGALLRIVVECALGLADERRGTRRRANLNLGLEEPSFVRRHGGSVLLVPKKDAHAPPTQRVLSDAGVD